MYILITEPTHKPELCHQDTQHNDIQLNDTQHKDTQHNYIQHDDKWNVTLSITTLRVERY